MITEKWIKSSFSTGNGGSCVEVNLALTPSRVQVRDTKLGEGSPVIEFAPDRWQAFVADVKDGKLLRTRLLDEGDVETWFWGEIPGIEMYVSFNAVPGDPEADPDIELHFTKAEWDAFVKGCHAGEFDVPEHMKALDR